MLLPECTQKAVLALMINQNTFICVHKGREYNMISGSAMFFFHTKYVWAGSSEHSLNAGRKSNPQSLGALRETQRQREEVRKMSKGACSPRTPREERRQGQSTAEMARLSKSKAVMLKPGEIPYCHV